MSTKNKEIDLLNDRLPLEEWHDYIKDPEIKANALAEEYSNLFSKSYTEARKFFNYRVTWEESKKGRAYWQNINTKCQKNPAKFFYTTPKGEDHGWL